MPTPQLLISVRNPAEARAALAGHADLIDIKNPAAGSLGKATPDTINDILQTIADQRPVSAALGELHELTPPPPQSLRYLKLGLAHAPTDWRQRLTACADTLGRRRFIAVAYADHARAAAPPIDDVLDWAIAQRVGGFLLDTAVKDGRTLLDWCSGAALQHWIDTAHRHHLLVALAGSLTRSTLPSLLPLDADVIAVRSAACARRDRCATVQPHLVRQLKQALAAHSAAAMPSAG
ncbi:MAG: (5-formylfuran-3-yl)methyl phosphate synthase [Phycisphaeraceae bacterium]